ncbi:MAG: glycosyltransferase family 2 protein [Candidatus Bathyarchaeia archaeon]
MTGDLKVSVNIPTYNSEETIGECLQSVKEQTYPDIEIIVIDGFSHDGTLRIAREFGARTYFAKVLSDARRVGVEKSRGKYVLLLDSDQVLERNVIQRCVEKCENEGYDAVTLFEQSIMERDDLLHRVVAYDKWLLSSTRDEHVMYGSTIPRFFRKDVLKKIEWPRDLLIFDHYFIYLRALEAGAKTCFLDTKIYHHEPPTWASLIRKNYRYGRHYLKALGRDKRLVISHSIPRKVYITGKAFRNPSLFIGLLFLYLVKATSTTVGALSSLLSVVD